MNKENVGKKIFYGIMVIAIILVIGIIIVNFNNSKNNLEMKNMTNTVANEIEEDMPEENPNIKRPENAE